jgi:hypothetical protein
MSAGDAGKDRKPQPGGQEPSGQQGSKGQQQAQGGQGQQMGEGSYSGTKQYNEGLKKHMNQHDIEKEALDAAPKSDQEAREMDEAERIGRSKAKGAEEDDRGMGDGGVKRQGQ